MIDSMFCPFAIKYAAERHTTLLVNSRNQTPSLMLNDVEIEAILVKTFHTLFFPVHVPDSRNHGAGGPGTPKWEPCCHIGVYLGHSPFHAGSVALVFSPSTSLVSPQLHVVFDDTFSIVPCMNAGTNLPNWADLVMHYSDLSTDKDFELAQNWSSDIPSMVPQSERAPNPDIDRIIDPFAVVPDKTYATKKNQRTIYLLSSNRNGT